MDLLSGPPNSEITFVGRSYVFSNSLEYLVEA
jgi:hypothetical protein